MPARIMTFDIETTNLGANYGFMLAAAWTVVGEKKITCVDISQSPTFNKRNGASNDKWVVQQVAEALDGADIIVGWYSQKFDYPYIQTRLLHHKLKPMGPKPHVDGWRIARYQMKLNNNRLQTLTNFFGYEDKTPLKNDVWVAAMTGDKASIKYVARHCIRDVEITEKVYLKIRPLMTTHPNVNIIDEKSDACPVCGKKSLHKRGFSIAQVSRTQRYQCQSCGTWSKGRPQRIKALEVR